MILKTPPSNEIKGEGGVENYSTFHHISAVVLDRSEKFKIKNLLNSNIVVNLSQVHMLVILELFLNYVVNNHWEV